MNGDCGLLKYCLKLFRKSLIGGVLFFVFMSLSASKRVVAANVVPELEITGSDLLEARRTGDLGLLAEGRLNLAKFYCRNQQWGVASYIIKKSLHDLSSYMDPSLEVQFLLLSARIDFLSGKVRSSELVLRSLLDHWPQGVPDIGKCEVLLQLAAVFHHKNPGQQVWPLLTEALHLVDADGNNWRKAAVYHKLGTLCRDHGEVAVASQFLLKSSTLFGLSNDLKSKAMVNLTLSSILLDAGLPKAAVGYSEEALKLYKSLPFSDHHQRLLGYAYNSLGMAYNKLNRTREALECYQQALEVWGVIGDKKNQVFAADNIVNLMMTRGDLVQSGNYLALAARLNGPVLNDIQSAVLTHTRSRYCFSVHKVDSAAFWAEVAAKQFLKTGVLNLAVEAYSDLVKYETNRGNFREALEASNAVHKLSDSLAGGLTSAAVAALQIEYDAKLNQKAISSLHRDMELSHLMLNRTRNYLVIVGVSTLFILTLALSLWIQIKKRNQAYGVLLEKNMQIMQLKTPGQGSRKSESQGSSVHLKDDTDSRFTGDFDGIALRLEKAMEIDSLYRDPSITLHSLAQALATNSSYLSRVINEKYATNFSSYINTYRIKEACSLLQEGQAAHHTLEAIGQQVGFSSRASFYSAFRKITGLTPGLYVEQLKSKRLIIR